MLIKLSPSYKNHSISSTFWGKCFFYAFLFSVLVTSSCKNPDEIGLDVIPASDHLNTLFTDTLTVSVATQKQDSLRSDEVSQILLGSISDSHFGTSIASLYTQVLLGQTPSLGANLTADSLVLSFGYLGHYGDTVTPNTIHVYRMSEDMYLDSAYYTSRYFNADSSNELAANTSYTLHPSDSSMVSSVNQPLQLRIKMTQAFADSIMALANNSSANTSNDSWKTYFKGLYIKVDPVIGTNVGSVLYFNPGSVYTKMTLYYKSDTTAKTYDFTLYGTAARVNHQIHDYTGSSAGNQLVTPSFNDSLAYLQAMSGLRTSISFPYLKNMISSGKILINKAELVITVADTSNSALHSVPSSLFLSAKDSVGGLIFVSDYLDQLISFGGAYTIASNTYKFNIGRHLQRILDNNIGDYGFSLDVPSGVVQANRVIIGSGKGTANPAKMKLNLFYTKL